MKRILCNLHILVFLISTIAVLSIGTIDAQGQNDSIANLDDFVPTCEPVHSPSPSYSETGTTRSVDENSESGTAIGSPVSATNFNSTYHRYVLGGILGVLDGDLFSIDSETGQLYTSASLDYETKSSYSVLVSVEQLEWCNISLAEDLDVKYIETDTILVTININDVVNEDPSAADALSTLTSEERARIASLVQLNTVIFNELLNASNDAHDWIELRNVTNADVDLSGWSLIVTSPEGGKSIALAEGTVLPAGGVLLLLSTDPSDPNMPLAVPNHYLVDEALTLPQGDFLLLLRSVTEWEDAAGSYLLGHEELITTVDFTLDTAWSRTKASIFGHRAEAWVVSGYQDGLGYDNGTSEDIGLGTPGHRREMLGDVNGDGSINILDLVLVASQIGQSGETTADLNRDGVVNIQDLILIANGIGGAAAAPSGHTLMSVQVREWLRLAKEEATLPIQTSVSQPNFSYGRGVQVLEQLLQMLIPQETALLANYPNPFNPETWIPYQLATESDVRITIYDARGTLVRQFDLGHQPAGSYQNRGRAAYWDGRNAFGESVASGIYFYTLTAGDFSATRKMLILK